MNQEHQELHKVAEQQMSASGLDLSVVLPVFQEAGTIEMLLDSLFSTLSQLDFTSEVVVVDDGSGAATHRALRRAQSRHGERLIIAQHLENRGNGAALRTGIRIARGKIVVTMDADGQHDPAHIKVLLEQIPPYDLVIGARTKDYQGNWYRGLANRFYNQFASWLAQRPIADLTSGFRAMRRQVVLHFLPLFPEGFSAPTTTTLSFLKAGYNVKFVPVIVGQRSAGESKIRLWRDGTRFVTLILRMIMLYDPLRIFLPAGFGLAFLGVLAWIAGLINAQRLVFPNSTIFLFSSALVTMLLGLVSNQIVTTQVHYHGDETILFVEDSEPDEVD